ncbi:MAG: RNA-directed DNA polymerase [Gammaproteobacteria bacterium]|nr:RNA-directed DNA polymerase [Gammaproteobacteria bacterium]
MYDQALTQRTLRNTLRRSDYVRYSRLRDPKVLAACLRLADRYLRNFENTLSRSVGASDVRGRKVNYIASFPLELILRKINTNLRLAFRTQPSNRDNIIRTLCEALRDSNSYAIYRIDIKSFYESIDHELLNSTISANRYLSTTTSRLICAISSWHISKGGEGLPRGLSTSATMSEIYMNSFDMNIPSMDTHFFYCRFADDIVFMHKPEISRRSALDQIKSKLPPGLALNRRKSKHYLADAVPNGGCAATSKAIQFEYLGYSISAINPIKSGQDKVRREIEIDMAQDKVKKIKSRIMRSLIDFCKNKDFQLLSQRLRFLTGNYKVREKNGKFSRVAGIFYNYPLITIESSLALPDLDKFLRSCILSKNGRVFSKSSSLLDKKKQNELLSNSFKKGFSSRSIRHFSPRLLSKIQECWKYA